jgi:hypothetical protein
MDRGSVYRRCGCRDEATGRLLGARCPGLLSREHGSWYFSADLPSAAGERHRVRRGGFATQDAASAALEALASPTAGPEPGLSTGEWLSRWLESRVSLRASTSRGYAAHVRSYLVPYLGGIPLAALTAGDVQAMFTAVIQDEGALGQPVSAATLHRIHATLRAALNGAARAGLISVNPGRYPELPRAARPRPQVWTPALTGRWQLHHRDRDPVPAGPDDTHVREAGRRLRAAAGHATRTAARRRHPRPGRGSRPQGRAGPARPLHDRADRRHLHQACCRKPPAPPPSTPPHSCSPAASLPAGDLRQGAHTGDFRHGHERTTASAATPPECTASPPCCGHRRDIRR